MGQLRSSVDVHAASPSLLLRATNASLNCSTSEVKVGIERHSSKPTTLAHAPVTIELDVSANITLALSRTPAGLPKAVNLSIAALNAQPPKAHLKLPSFWEKLIGKVSSSAVAQSLLRTRAPVRLLPDVRALLCPARGGSECPNGRHVCCCPVLFVA